MIVLIKIKCFNKIKFYSKLKNLIHFEIVYLILKMWIGVVEFRTLSDPFSTILTGYEPNLKFSNRARTKPSYITLNRIKSIRHKIGFEGS